jgi:hypothetical protein
VRELSKFISLFVDKDKSSGRLLFKEIQSQHLEHITRKSMAERNILRKIHGKGDNDSRIKMSDIKDNKDLREKMLEFPHIKSAFDVLNATTSNQKENTVRDAPNK